MTTPLHIRGISPELRERLEVSAGRNSRSLNQEALARIQFSFDLEDRNQSAQLNQLVGAGLKGDQRAGSAARLHKIAAKARR